MAVLPETTGQTQQEAKKKGNPVNVKRGGTIGGEKGGRMGVLIRGRIRGPAEKRLSQSTPKEELKERGNSGGKEKGRGGREKVLPESKARKRKGLGYPRIQAHTSPTTSKNEREGERISENILSYPDEGTKQV